MAFRLKFDRVSKTLLLRVEGQVTDESLAECYGAAQRYAAATDARAGIVDFSSVTGFAVSTDLIRQLADQEPILDRTRPRFIVAPTALLFGTARMFQILGEPTRPLLDVVHTMGEALAALGVESPHFEPLA